MLKQRLTKHSSIPASFHSKGVTLEDEKLWEGLVQGNEIAFDEIYNRYFDKLYVYGRHMTHDTDLVKDAIQELFVELWKYRTKLSSVNYVKAYLYKSIRRKLLKQLKAMRSTDLVNILDESMHVTYSRERSLIKEQTHQRQKEILAKAFENLSSRQKEAIILKYYNDLSYQEIASVMSLQKVKSARTLLYRAVDVLKASLKHKKIFYHPIAIIIGLVSFLFPYLWP